MSDSGSKEDIKETLFAAAEHPASQMATAMLIRDLLNFKVAQATDKNNTTDPERWLTNLPMHIADVNRLKPKDYIIARTNFANPEVRTIPRKTIDLDTFKLQQFIANSSSWFKKQIPATFKALLDQVITKLPQLKSRLVDSYTAKFLMSNDVSGITDNDVRNALIVGTRKRPTALEIKTFIEQLCKLPQEVLGGRSSKTFTESCSWRAYQFKKIFEQCVVDWERYTIDRPRSNGYVLDQGWNIHVFQVLEFVKMQHRLSEWSKLQDFLKGRGRHIWEYVRNTRPFAATTNIYTGASWLVFFSVNQAIQTPGVFLSEEIPQLGKSIADADKPQEFPELGYNKPGFIPKQKLEKSNLQCALPGGWMDIQYLQIHSRWFQTFDYNVSRNSFIYYQAYELYWVPQGIEHRNFQGDPHAKLYESERNSFPSQGSWWVILKADISISRNYNYGTVTINPIGQNYSWEVFDSKPDFPKIIWPIPSL